MPADPHERLDGLRTWLAQVDRRVGTLIYALGATAVLALAAGIGGLALALDAQEDKATQAELEQVNDRLHRLEESSLQTSRHREDVGSLAKRLDRFNARLSSLNDAQAAIGGELSAVQNELNLLRGDVAALEASTAPSTP